MLCACAVVNAQNSINKPVVYYSEYSAVDCAAGTELLTALYVQNVCDGYGGNGTKYTCTNNVPSYNSYVADPTCTGTISSTNPLPSTCSIITTTR